jgi:hypothetical protein
LDCGVPRRARMRAFRIRSASPIGSFSFATFQDGRKQLLPKRMEAMDENMKTTLMGALGLAIVIVICVTLKYFDVL